MFSSRFVHTLVLLLLLTALVTSQPGGPAEAGFVQSSPTSIIPQRRKVSAARTHSSEQLDDEEINGWRQNSALGLSSRNWRPDVNVRIASMNQGTTTKSAYNSHQTPAPLLNLVGAPDSKQLPNAAQQNQHLENPLLVNTNGDQLASPASPSLVSLAAIGTGKPSLGSTSNGQGPPVVASAVPILSQSVAAPSQGGPSTIPILPQSDATPSLVPSAAPSLTVPPSPATSVGAVVPSTSPSSNTTPSISVSLPSASVSPSNSQQPAKPTATPSPSTKPSAPPLVNPTAIPEATPIPSGQSDATNSTENQTSNSSDSQDTLPPINLQRKLGVDENLTISIGTQGQLIKRGSSEVSNSRYSEELIVLSMKSNRILERTEVAGRNSLNVSSSIVTINACIMQREQDPSLLSLYAFRRQTFLGDDLIASRGAMGSAMDDEDQDCFRSVRLDIPDSYPDVIYLVLSRNKRFGAVNVRLSTSRSTNAEAVSPMLWNRDLLSLPEKDNNTLNLAEKSKIFVISSWPNLEHVELLGATIDTSGLQQIYGSPSRLPRSICDDLGTQLVTSVVGSRIGIGPRSTVIVPIPVRDCERSYSRSVILSALRFVRTTVDVSARAKDDSSSHPNTFVLFDEYLQETGLVNDVVLLKELELLSNLGVVNVVPGKTCNVKRPSYVAVRAFGRRVSDNTQRVELSDKYVIDSSQCLDLFDVFGPGDYSTSVYTAGPESYRTIMQGCNVAAGGIVSVFLFLSSSLNVPLNITKVKDILDEMGEISPLIGNISLNEFQGIARELPLLGAGSSLSDLRKSFTKRSSESSKESIGFFRTISKLSTAVIVGISLTIGVVLLLLILAYLYLRRRKRKSNTDEEEESVYEVDIETASLTHDSTTAKQDTNRNKKDSAARESEVASPIPLRKRNENHDKDTSVAQPQPIRMPVVQRLLSMNRSKESPITRGDKASWFATPKAPDGAGNRTFKR